jgi:hypothetical protein
MPKKDKGHHKDEGNRQQKIAGKAVLPENSKACTTRWMSTKQVQQSSLAGNVGNMSAKCRQYVKMLMNLGIFACGCRHQNLPDTRFLCRKIPTL